LVAYADTHTFDLGVYRRICGPCSLHQLCWPIGMDSTDLEHLQSMVRHAGPLPAGSYLFRIGDQFTAIYAVRMGCIKSYSVGAGGHELVHGFHVPGELLGFDAIYPDRHRCSALILEPSSVCVIPYLEISRLSVEFRSLQGQVLQLMSREFTKQHMYAEGTGATQRIARFLLDMQTRLQQSGEAEFEFKLPMSREDISNYLGIKPETLSRLMTKLQKKGLIDVDRRHIYLVDPIRLDLTSQGIH